ncbi:VOC family protein [Pedobacter insulae]|nr:glyoxalase [Pedobacter insulae]
MKYHPLSIRPFLGAEDFELSRNFYRYIGFQEVLLGAHLSLFKVGEFGFYLQHAYVKDWIENTMVFMEVENLDQLFEDYSLLDLQKKYKKVRLIPIRTQPWGRAFFLHDPSGILWHFGVFNKQ